MITFLLNIKYNVLFHVQDICEATEFNPPVLYNGDVRANDKISICALQFSIHRISATLRNMYE